MAVKTGVAQASGYMSVREVAQQLGVSVRSVYGYLEMGKLSGIRIGDTIAVPVEALDGFQRGVVGRTRTRTPIWRIPMAENQQYTTTIKVRVRQGQQERLAQKLEEMRAKREHLLPGTVARSIIQNMECPEEIQIILVWRELVMPPKEEREAAMEALRDDLADLLEWESATVQQWQAMLYA